VAIVDIVGNAWHRQQPVCRIERVSGGSLGSDIASGVDPCFPCFPVSTLFRRTPVSAKWFTDPCFVLRPSCNSRWTASRNYRARASNSSCRSSSRCSLRPAVETTKPSAMPGFVGGNIVFDVHAAGYTTELLTRPTALSVANEICGLLMWQYKTRPQSSTPIL